MRSQSAVRRLTSPRSEPCCARSEPPPKSGLPEDSADTEFGAANAARTPFGQACQEGFGALGDVELLGLLLGRPPRSGGRTAAARALDRCGGVVTLSGLGPLAVAERTGLGIRQAAAVAAAIELGRRVVVETTQPSSANGPWSAETVARWARPRLAGLGHEEVWVLCLDGRMTLRSATCVARGGVHGCALTTRDVLTPVVRDAASAFVLVHNHPSGDPAPSHQDIVMTRALAASAELLSTPLLDHVVVARGGHRSLYDMGVLDEEEWCEGTRNPHE